MNAKKYLILSSRKILAAATSLENFLHLKTNFSLVNQKII